MATRIQPTQAASMLRRVALKAARSLMGFSGLGGGIGAWGWDAFGADGSTNNQLYRMLSPDTDIDYEREVGGLRLYQSSLALAAANWVGRVLPESPLQVTRTGPAGEAVPIADHAMTALLRRPNPFYAGARLWKAFATSWVLNGNVYLLKARNPQCVLTELWYLPHWWVAPRWPADGSEFISHYEYRVDGISYRLPVGDIIHFRDGEDPFNARLGLSPFGALY